MAQDAISLYGNGMQAYDRERITVGSGVSTLTSTKYLPTTGSPAGGALINIQDNGVYLTLEGTTPSASAGIKLDGNAYIIFQNVENLKNLKMTRQSSDTAVEVTYLR